MFVLPSPAFTYPKAMRLNLPISDVAQNDSQSEPVRGSPARRLIRYAQDKEIQKAKGVVCEDEVSARQKVPAKDPKSSGNLSGYWREGEILNQHQHLSLIHI